MDPTTLDLLKEWGALGLFVAWATWLIRFQRSEREARDTGWRQWMDTQRESFISALAAITQQVNAHDEATTAHVDRLMQEIRRGGGDR